MNSSENRQLLDAVRAWAAVNYPGHPVEYLSIHLRFLPVSIRLADTPISPTATPPPGTLRVPMEASESDQSVTPIDDEADDESYDHRYSRCCGDILEALEKAKQPLTTTRILSALGKAGKEWSERWVQKMLKRMMDDGTIENPKGAKPSGYRLPEWEPGEMGS